jgi:nitroimidazol reductase NimA-like FMN-containing flavoprotein (pyridoxamine 5'-phosphate oxidase superfamily)
MSRVTETTPRSAISDDDAGAPEAALVVLDRSECLQLLATVNVGRIAVVLADSGQPLIRPVNYVFDTASQSVVIRSRSGSKLHALLHAKRAAFEIDGTKDEGRLSWSVIVHGVVEEVVAPSELRRVERLGLESKAPARDSRWLRIRLGTVSGRVASST